MDVLDIRRIEQAGLASSEQRALEIQEHYEKMIAKKEAEISSLLSSLQDMKVRRMALDNDSKRTMNLSNSYDDSLQR